MNFNKTMIIKIIYLLYAVSFIFGGITALVGFLMALFLRDGANFVEESHFKYLTSLFIVYVIVGVIGLVTIPIVIGIFILFGLFCWTIYKIIKGISALNKNEAIE